MLTLGRLLTFTISIRDEHAVVTRGPYRLLRHPGYAGWLVAMIGISRTRRLVPGVW
jgi:protein-S-isoprenylcysteine O-methyltransferase Ste14